MSTNNNDLHNNESRRQIFKHATFIHLFLLVLHNCQTKSLSFLLLLLPAKAVASNPVFLLHTNFKKAIY